ncbi:MAG: hypothetical protein H8E34_09505 [Bacteroidetes bacterium]|nr:hypothetical protein [Bacteroidota bacterium]MBL6942828.1 hypothetical protein [Bacteroidales bacterium]
MEKQKNINTQQGRGGSNLWMYIIIVIMALGIISVSLWLLSVKSTMNELLAEKELQKKELQNELQILMEEHEEIKIAYGDVADSLQVMDSVIQANAIEIKKMLNYKWEYYKIKKKMSKLQEIAQGYVRQMDSIVTVINHLTEENLQIKEEIKIEKQKYRKLEEQTVALSGKVEEASVFNVYNLKSSAVHKKGDGKEVETDKIRRVDLIKVCFTLGENSIINPGKKTIYVRIAQPDKKILVKGSDDKYSFNFNNEVLQYSIMEVVNYENSALDLCVRWHKRITQELKPGLYHVDVFEGDNNIGHTTFVLR